MAITRKAIVDQARDLEEGLWQVAERLGLPQSAKTKETLLSLHSAHSDKYMEARTKLEDAEGNAPLDLLPTPNTEEKLGGCFYMLDLIADTKQVSDETLMLLCAANFFAGIVEGVTKAESGSASLNQLFVTLGRSGAVKRHAANASLREWSIAQYRAGTWKSANKAAHDLKDLVIEHGRKIGVHLTKENAQRTIAEWFRKSV